MAPALMSRSSNETSVWRGCWPGLWDSVLMVLNGLRQFRVAEREKRHLLQIESKKAKPQSAEGEGQNNVQPSRHGPRSEFRPRHPEQVHETHEDEPHGDLWEDSRVALHILRKEQEKRDEEMEHQHDYGDDAPAAVQPRAIEADFFRLVPRPDDQELREIEIRPEHHESEEQFSQIVQMALLQDAGEWFGARQQHDDRDHERHRGDQLSRYEQEAVDGGGPMRRQGHYPVDGCKGHDKNVKNDARASQHFQAAAQTTVFAVGVLLLRQTIEDQHQRKPDDKVNDRAHLKAPAGQKSLLKLRQWLFLQFFRIEPGAREGLHDEKQDGKKKRDDQRQRSGRRLQRTADDDAPVAARQILQHFQAQR